MSLLDDITEGEAVKARERDCPLCVYIDGITDEETKSALIRAAAGTMGINRLGAVLIKNGAGIGRRTIEHHRRGEHQA